MHYLYKITNRVNNKVYIGQTNDPGQRWSTHKYDSKNPKYPLHHAIAKYTKENFLFDVIATCKNQDDANHIEEVLIKQYESHISTGKGYNIDLGGNTSPRSDETKAKLSAQKTAFYQNRLEETGSKMTAEEIQKLSESHKGHVHTEEHKAKIGAASKGNQYRLGTKDSDETKEKKHQASLRNGNLPPAGSHLGHHHSDETKQKLSKLKRKLSPEQEQQIITLYHSGLGCVKIGKQLNLHDVLVFRTLKRHNIETRTS